MPALDDPMTQETKSNCTVEEKSTAPLLTLFLDPCCDARNEWVLGSWVFQGKCWGKSVKLCSASVLGAQKLAPGPLSSVEE